MPNTSDQKATPEAQQLLASKQLNVISVPLVFLSSRCQKLTRGSCTYFSYMWQLGYGLGLF